jgi:NAD(P)-dependent dehydrogenase (short-subunit alcohol dehydrogenase family)
MTEHHSATTSAARNPPKPQHVLVTGASTGIGADAALSLARGGWHVFAGVRKQEDGQRLVEVFHGSTPEARSATGRIEPLILDVTESEHIAAAAKHIDSAVGAGGLEALVNNAGIVVSGPLEMLALDRFRYQLEVNVTGVLAVTQACLPMLRRAFHAAVEGHAGRRPRIGARVVNVSSVNGALAPPYMGPYAASKTRARGD